MKDRNEVDLIDRNDINVQPHPRRRLGRGPSGPEPRRDRALGPLFDCYRALLNLPDPSYVEREAESILWDLIDMARREQLGEDVEQTEIAAVANLRGDE